MGGSKSGGAQTYVYYGTIACGVCVGPVDALISIILNGQEVWPQGTPWTGVGGTSTAGTLYVYDAQTWVCTTTVTNTANNAPGGSDLTPGWAQYTFPRGSAHYNDFSITTSDDTYYGVLRFYWGTQTTADYYLSAGNNDGPGLNGTGGGDQHPSYAGLCYIVLIDFLFGEEIQSAPNIEVVVRKAPTQAVVTGTPATIVNGQANLAAVVCDLLTNPNCIGLPSADIDATSFQAVANYLQTQAAICGSSVLVDSSETLRSVLQKVTDLIDGFVRFNPATGLIEMGVYEHGIVPATYVALTEDSLTEAPQIKTTSWQGTYSRATVRYPDRQLNYQQTSLHADDARAWTVLKSVRDMQLDRPYITIGTQAMAHGREMLRLLGHAQMTGKIKVRREIARNIRAGSYVLLDVDIEPNNYTVSAFFRVTKRTIPMTGPITLEIFADNTLSTVPALSAATPVVPVATAIPAITAYRVLEVPTVLSGERGAVTVLAQRPTDILVGAQLWFDTSQVVTNPITSIVVDGTGNNAVITFGTAHGFQAGNLIDVASYGQGGSPVFDVTAATVSAVTTFTVKYPLTAPLTPGGFAGTPMAVAAYTGTFSALGTMPSFAAFATLNANLSNTAATVTVDVAAQVDADYFNTSYSANDQANDTLLAIIISTNATQIAFNGGNPVFEICSIGTQTLVSAGVYTLSILRGRQNTAPTAFNAMGTEVWVIPRGLLSFFNSANFDTIRANQLIGTVPARAQFALCAYTFASQMPLSSATPFLFQFPPNSITVPTLALTLPATATLSYPAVAAYPFTIPIAGTWTDPDGVLVETTVKLRLATESSDRLVQDITFAPCASRALGAGVQIEQAGSYTIKLLARDSHNLTTEVDIPVSVVSSGSPAAKCAMPDAFDVNGVQLLNAGGTPAVYESVYGIGNNWSIVTTQFVPFGVISLKCSTPSAVISFACSVVYNNGSVTSANTGFKTYAPGTLQPFNGLVGPNSNSTAITAQSNVIVGYVIEAYATAPGFGQSNTIYFIIKNLH